MKAKPLAALAVLATSAAWAASTTPQAVPNRDELEDLSLEELLDLRESILEAKMNMSYAIWEGDPDAEDDVTSTTAALPEPPVPPMPPTLPVFDLLQNLDEE